MTIRTKLGRVALALTLIAPAAAVASADVADPEPAAAQQVFVYSTPGQVVDKFPDPFGQDKEAWIEGRDCVYHYLRQGNAFALDRAGGPAHCPQMSRMTGHLDWETMVIFRSGQLGVYPAHVDFCARDPYTKGRTYSHESMLRPFLETTWNGAPLVKTYQQHVQASTGLVWDQGNVDLRGWEYATGPTKIAIADGLWPGSACGQNGGSPFGYTSRVFLH